MRPEIFSTARLLMIVAALVATLVLPSRGVRQFYSRHYSYMAHQLMNTGKTAQSQQSAVLAIRLNPYDGYARYHEATVHFSREEFQAALAKYNSAAPLMPHLPQLLRLRGQSHYKLGNYAAGAKDLDDYFRMVPEPRSAAGHLWKINGLSHLQAQEFGAATTGLLRSSGYPEQRAEAFRARITLGILMNRPQVALQALSTLVNSGHANQVRGAELLRNAVTANQVPTLITVLERYQETGGWFPGQEHTMAAAYAQAGRADEAIRFLQQRAASFSDSADLQLMLGDLLFKQGRHAEASAAYNAHLQLNPNSKFRDEILRRQNSP